MSNFAYYLLWLAAGLVIVAIASALIARHLRLRVLRRLKSVEVIAALQRYSDWVAAQRRALFVQDPTEESDSPLQEVRAISQQWFPELSVETQLLLDVHARLADFLQAQQALRLQDPEAWLESDHDARFLDLWRQHLHALAVVVEKLDRVAAVPGPGPGTTHHPA